MDRCLLYISRSSLALPREASEIDGIVATSLARNAALGITGALVFTEKQFAQYLEGPAAGIHELMDSIRADRRHCDVSTIFEEPIASRRFPNWSLAYAGPSTFVAGHVLTVADTPVPQRQVKAAKRLVDLMRQFVEARLIERNRADSAAR